MQMTVEELMQCMLGFFQNVDRDRKAEIKKLQAKEAQQNDLLHYIENHNLKAYEYAQIGKMIKEVRRERRQIKYNIEMLNTIKKFTDKYNNKMIVKDIIQNLKLQRDLKHIQENPTYRYRTDILNKKEKGKKNVSD